MRINVERRRARKASAPVNDLTAAQWKEIKARFGHRCAYCGVKPKTLTQDHITPLSQGGSHTASNIVPACITCNAKKGTKAVLAPVQPLLLTLN
jgi:5-methylcytosine-specific restriction endonuclease McrA